MMTETDIELLKDLRVDYEPYYKETLPLTAMKTYEQERHLAASLIDRQTAFLAARDAEIARLRALVRTAYNEGFMQGMREHTSSKGGIPWSDSKIRAALDAPQSIGVK